MDLDSDEEEDDIFDSDDDKVSYYHVIIPDVGHVSSACWKSTWSLRVERE